MHLCTYGLLLVSQVVGQDLFLAGTGPVSQAPPPRVNASDDKHLDLGEPSCNNYTFKNHLHVYHIMDKSEHGVAEKNAGGSISDMTFIFGSASKPEPRGCNLYYSNGVVEMNWISYTSWGTYLLCDHPPGSSKYRCEYDPHKPVPPGADKKHAGRENDAHTGGYWYSFPAAGEGKYWQDENKHCPRQRHYASTVIKAIGDATGCKCNSASECDSCGACVRKASDAVKQAAWDYVFGWKPKPPHPPHPPKPHCFKDGTCVPLGGAPSCCAGRTYATLACDPVGHSKCGCIHQGQCAYLKRDCCSKQGNRTLACGFGLGIHCA